MSHEAPVDYPIQRLLRKRWSPYVFDPDRQVSREDLLALFESARWTMSSYNAQPWRYIVGVKHSDAGLWQKIFSVLVEGNQKWARNAPVLCLGIVEHSFEHNGKDNKAALHDLGAASAYLTIEAVSRGLLVHQMIGIEPEKARDLFGIRGSLEPITALAIGYHGDPSTADHGLVEREKRRRERKRIEEIILAGQP